MNLLKRLWTGLVKKTATAEIEPTPVEVEEETDPEAVADIFTKLCEDAGIARKWIVRYDMAAVFVDWYDGPADVESIRGCIAQFKKETPSLASKLAKLN
tara:strand:+ start:377 stop:673 length:297 start_codon:yes stop_codon:yes gene_type:complete